MGGSRRLFESHGKARCVCLARSSSAVAPSRQAAQGHPVNAGATPGRPSFEYFSWPIKKSTQPPGCPRPLSRARRGLTSASSGGGVSDTRDDERAILSVEPSEGAKPLRL